MDKDWLKFISVVIFGNVVVLGGIGLTWLVMKDTNKSEYIAYPIVLWIFAMILTFNGLCLIIYDEKHRCS